jgi:energy-coupling factor transporter ATP-binding protein EcfA2
MKETFTELIKIEELTYAYPNRVEPALERVSLHVEAGEFVLLAGPSGAGKSTLLRCLNGLVPHFSGGRISGTVYVAGQNVLEAGPKVLSRVVGMVFQDPEAQAVLDTVEAEIAFGLENLGLGQAEMRLRVEEVLSLLELNDLRKRSLSSLSGGERQRLAIAAALATRPHILVLDEPTSQLDPKSAADVLQAVVHLNEELGLTVLLAEHRLERVTRYADRLVYLEEGKVTVDGPLREALSEIKAELQPPMARLATQLGWFPLPLTTKEGLRFARSADRADVHNTRRGITNTPAQNGKDPVLKVEGLQFSYNGTPVLRGIDLQIKPGESVALLGRNGSGKSTLLKCLVGLLRPRQGQVWVEGRSSVGRPVAEICRQVAYLPQTPDDLLFAETVADELEITLANHRLRADTLELSPADLLERLGIAQMAEMYPRDLSVGQRQRVALGAVLVTGPRLLLLDEPTRGLDYGAKRDLIELWRQWQMAGMGLLLVTHDVETAARIADRVLVLSDGQIIVDGPARTVLRATPLFTPQIGRLFPTEEWLTVEEALDGLKSPA